MSDEILDERKVKEIIDGAHGTGFIMTVGDSASEILNKHLLDKADACDGEEHCNFVKYILDAKNETIDKFIDDASNKHGLNCEELFVHFDSEEAEEIFHGMIRDMVEDNDKTYEGLGI